MKNKVLVILCLLLLMFSFSACSEIKKNNESNTVSLEQPAATAGDDSKELSENDTKQGTSLSNAKNNNQNSKINNSQNSAYTSSDGENKAEAETPPTLSAEENATEKTSDKEAISTDSDGWINKWY